MDNSDLRRGNPTCHKKFGETIALLAGDALLTHALTLLSEAYFETPKIAAALTKELGNAASSQKMIGGQVEDTIGELGEATAERLDFIHENKTAALISAAISMGFILGNADEETLKIAKSAGKEIGIAFQIVDDILDEISDSETIGKPVRADFENKKFTYPKFHGIEKSRSRARELTKSAVEKLKKIRHGNVEFLVALTENLAERIS